MSIASSVKIKLSIVFMLLLWFKCSNLAAQSDPNSAWLDTLTIIHVNDTHSNLLPYAGGKRGGMARAATVISRWKTSEPNPILVHCGDFMVGTLIFNRYFGMPELRLLNKLGFDALLLGNHEFDVGAEQLGEIIHSAGLDSNFHILCSNAENLPAVPRLASVINHQLILQSGKLKVGIFGLTTPSANVESHPAPVVLDTNLSALAQKEIQSLRQQGCQVVLLLSHLGLPVDKQLATTLSGVDAIIGGHTHSVLRKVLEVNGIPIVQAGEFYHYVGKLRLVYDSHRQQSRILDYTLQEIDESVPEDTLIAKTINQLKQGVTDAFSPVLGNPYQVIAHTEKLLSHLPDLKRSLSTAVGNLVTAALRWHTKEADCVLEPTGHIVEDIYPGPITPADLFRVYPYGYDPADQLGFRVATFQLSGAQISGILQALTRYIDPENNRFDYLMQSDGLRFTLQPQNGGLALQTVTIGGQPIQEDSLYTLVSSSRTVEYLQSLFHIQPLNLTIPPLSVVQVLTEFVKQKQIQLEKLGGRNLSRQNSEIK